MFSQRLSILVCALTFWAGLQMSPAVQVFTTGSPTTYESAPPNEQGFNYTGTVNGSSGVYLGKYNGSYFVLTADHVGGGNFTLGSTSYTLVPSSYTQVQIGVDLGVFAITSADTTPLDALTNLILSSITPLPTTQVNMVGYGGGTKRGGFNTVDSIQPLIYSVGTNNYSETGFITTFDSAEGEAQATVGDSGGGVFRASASGAFELNGIMVVEGTNGSGKPITGSVDVATYRTQILAAAPEPSVSGCLLVGGLLSLGIYQLRKKHSV